MRDDEIIAEVDGLFELNFLHHIVNITNYMSNLLHSLLIAPFIDVAVRESLINDFHNN